METKTKELAYGIIRKFPEINKSVFGEENKRVIGYQIVKYYSKSKKFDDVPDGLFSFVIWRYYYNAVLYLKNVKHKIAFKIEPIYDGDIEEPTFYEDVYPNVKETANKIERIKKYLGMIPNVQVSYVNEKQGQIYFKGVVRGNFLEELKESINATDAYVTYLPAMIAPGVVVCFNFKND